MNCSITNIASGYVLALSGEEVIIRNRSKSQTMSELWRIWPQGNGVFLIENIHNGYMLDVDTGGSIITTVRCPGTNSSQRWCLLPDNLIRNEKFDRVLAINQGDLSNNNKVILYREDSPVSPNQLFSFTIVFSSAICNKLF